jgi:hypothetical protein
MSFGSQTLIGTGGTATGKKPADPSVTVGGVEASTQGPVGDSKSLSLSRFKHSDAPAPIQAGARCCWGSAAGPPMPANATIKTSAHWLPFVLESLTAMTTP